MTEAISSSSNSYYLPDQTETVQGESGLYDPDAFLKILVAQMTYQNPMEPQDSATFVTQLSAMASMEQMYNVSQSMDTMAAEYEMDRYFQLIGHEVSLVNGDEIINGRVEGVFISDQPYFYLEGDDTYGYTLDQVVDITGNLTDNSLLAYLTLVGRQVTVEDDSSEITGIVEKVLLQNGNVLITIDGSDYSVGQIIELQGMPEENTAQDPDDSGSGEEIITSPEDDAGTEEESATKV